MLSRRTLLTGSAAAAAFGGLARLATAQEAARAFSPYANEVFGYGALVPDPAGRLDLPQGFAYQVISRAGEAMDDGLVVPAYPDGMGCFDAGGGRVILIRNHETSQAPHGAFGQAGELAGKVDAAKIYDTAAGLPCPGGATRLVYDLKARRLAGQHLGLAGTLVNCAGGITPNGSWLTCEEIVTAPTAARSHGWVFEVPAKAKGLVDPVPLTGMGRFRHEATCTDPKTGIVYLTEDEQASLFYRFLPEDRDDLRKGGRLQALGFRNGMGDSRNWTTASWRRGERLDAVWIDMDGVDSPNADLRMRGHAKGAALFARGEGLIFGEGRLYFACTSGGPGRAGQIVSYAPSPREGQAGETGEPGVVELFVEPVEGSVMRMPDNLVVAPWGHLIGCEDRSGEETNHLRGITPDGRMYTFARNARSASEFAGACFSPDGSTMFVNLQEDGLTVAITGPWRSVRT